MNKNISKEKTESEGEVEKTESRNTVFIQLNSYLRIEVKLIKAI